ncbi:asparagine synthase (glutamine-hydrolyzing) [Sphingomonas cannabina]|uniref:asparagine synthase (glutamine-hydrolyzing) n=1 Tax=Sphingomonas cannabina TaxID=2899123 RepID=UPI001F1DA354|nr:asparagine synthase (glutamine-hydrolyzing) [Sphingomonas cannabina]UIJ46377.1 asparagine synthase (glutamine-hydrolyzing) [Sphingomonas cannabina]
MCGIAGWYARGAASVTHAVVAAQCRTIRHRGPDDEGILVDGDFGFGMRRLSIIDIAGGHQPIESPDGRHAIVFNGEIYNHLELRRELAPLGHAFRTHSDTETILAAWRQWGDAAWQRLDGMFAAAIWDRAERRLTLARDPLGIKPLYVTRQNGGLAFASELKALLPLPGHRFDVDRQAVHDVFSFGHIRTDRSIYAEVATLPPGHLLTIGAEGEAEIRPYWRPAYRQDPRLSDADWIEAMREHLLKTVERHLLADVEVGAFLSGGIDSSAVVAAMARLTGAPVKTFTIGFPVERYNEAPYAEAVARHLGTTHTTRIVDLAAARDLLPELQRCYDEPFADPSAVPTWYLSRLAREQVKVVLSGDGGDELFMGYKRHLTERAVGRMPALARHAARGILSLPPTPVRQWNRVLQRWQKAVGTAGLPDGASRFFAKTQITSMALRERVLDPELFAEFDGPGAYERLRDEYFPDPAAAISPDGLDQFAYADLTLNLPCAMLTKVDRASMANSLEVRVPLLSPVFVDWAMGVPQDMKVRGKTGKYILREAIKPWVPDGIVDRRKQGFQIPLAEWFDGDFGDYARELWHDSGAADLGFLRSGEVDALFAEHREGKRDHGRFLYALSMFSLWWTDRKAAPVEAPAPVAVTPRTPAVAANDPLPAAPGRRLATFGRAAAMAAMLFLGWGLHDVVGPVFRAPAQASSFVDEAVMSHRATLLRAAMRLEPGVAAFDRTAMERATGIAMPALPAGWKLLDVQVYPSAGGPSIGLAVQSERGERFSIFGMKAETPGGPTPALDKRLDDQVAYWEEGHLAFAVVGTLEAKRLLQLAAMLEPARPAAKTIT